jgi:hypothetical protein
MIVKKKETKSGRYLHIDVENLLNKGSHNRGKTKKVKGGGAKKEQ